MLGRMPDEPEAPPADSMSGGESNPIVAVGGITLPAMRLSGTLTVGHSGCGSGATRFQP